MKLRVSRVRMRKARAEDAYGSAGDEARVKVPQRLATSTAFVPVGS